jgi:predicted AAA+ superfamily ATPase
MMIGRQLQAIVEQRLQQYPAVALLGTRQVGKTTLAKAVAANHPGAIVLDMERQSDRAVLTRPELFLPLHRHRLVVLDEVLHLPALFADLRPEIDADRRAGRFLLFGSASGALLPQSGESLAGRVSYLELTPILAAEIDADLATEQAMWPRGG